MGEPGAFTAVPGGMPVVTAAEVPGVAVMVDARASERYRGESEPIDPVAGRIPGAVNVPTSANLTADGRFRPAADLREVYARVGATAGTPVAAYCGSGVTAAHDVLAMEVAGVRAALCLDAQTAEGARKWNDANALALSLRATSEAELGEILDAWFDGAPSNEDDDRANVAHIAEIEDGESRG